MLPALAALLLCADPIASITAEAGGRVGAAAQILEENRTILHVNEREHFPMQSVYKFPIGMAALAAVDHGTLRLDQVIHVDKSEYVRQGQHSPLRDDHPGGADADVRELLRLAVSDSDGSASDVLLRLVGPARVMEFLGSIGAKEIIVHDSEKVLGADWSAQYRNWATPAGAIVLLRAFFESRGLSPAGHDVLMKLMTESNNPSNRIKGLLPSGTVVAHKTGTSGTENGISAATNDIGIITLPNGHHLAIAVFVSDSRADNETRDRVIAKIARAAWDSAVRH